MCTVAPPSHEKKDGLRRFDAPLKKDGLWRYDALLNKSQSVDSFPVCHACYAILLHATSS